MEKINLVKDNKTKKYKIWGYKNATAKISKIRKQFDLNK